MARIPFEAIVLTSLITLFGLNSLIAQEPVLVQGKMYISKYELWHSEKKIGKSKRPVELKIDYSEYASENRIKVYNLDKKQPDTACILIHKQSIYEHGCMQSSSLLASSSLLLYEMIVMGLHKDFDLPIPVSMEGCKSGASKQQPELNGHQLIQKGSTWDCTNMTRCQYTIQSDLEAKSELVKTMNLDIVFTHDTPAARGTKYLIKIELEVK